jgi:hypothetical protein
MHLRNSLAVVTAAFAALLLGGCATLDKGRTQAVPVTSVPSGATVLVNGLPAGTTPITLKLSRQSAHQVTVQKRGFIEQSASLRTVPNEYTAKYFRFGFDYESGAMNDLVPERIDVTLRPAILPASKGNDPFAEMSALVAEIDGMKARGEISAEDHKVMLDQILAFYTN